MIEKARLEHTFCQSLARSTPRTTCRRQYRAPSINKIVSERACASIWFLVAASRHHNQISTAMSLYGIQRICQDLGLLQTKGVVHLILCRLRRAFPVLPVSEKTTMLRCEPLDDRGESCPEMHFFWLWWSSFGELLHDSRSRRSMRKHCCLKSSDGVRLNA